MKTKYYLNLEKNEKGYYEVHRANCPRLKRGMCSHYLGEYENCHSAMAKAGSIHSKVDGCAWCAFECHDTSLKNAEED